MASKVRRGKSFCVVYLVSGKQKWETYKTESEADARISEIAEKKALGNFVPPSPRTASEFLVEYVDVYGTVKWRHSTYSSNTSLIRNYIDPLIGRWKLGDITTKKMDSYFTKLKSQPAVQHKGCNNPGLISDRNIYEINLLLSNAFSKAVDWEYIGKNPITRNACPDRVNTKRGIWTPETAKTALALCTDMNLLACMHLAISCSMRIGEITGLRWQFISFGDVENNYDNAKLQIDSQLQRIAKESFEILDRKKSQIRFVFPTLRDNTSTMLVLKALKTKSSERTLWVPPTTAAILYNIKSQQKALKSIFGDEYQDFDMVIAQSTGRPLEGGHISEVFSKLIADNCLPKVGFHSLRHLSTTVKLLISRGDVKSVQGDTGHSQAKMVTDTYAHILDHNRRTMAKKFEESFFNSSGLDESPQEVSAEQVIALFANYPESFEMLLKILGTNRQLIDRMCRNRMV